MPSEASPALGAPDTWVAPLARAVPALVLGLVITFSQDHSAAFGLVAFEPPDLGVPHARPLWRGEVHPQVLGVEDGGRGGAGR